MPRSFWRRGLQWLSLATLTLMPTELDVYKPERWVDDALFRAEVREAFGHLVGQGWTDALRARHPGERIYTFWDYFRNAWNRNAGLRIDHLLLSPSVAARLAAAGVDREVRGWPKARRISFAFSQFLAKAIADPVWARLVVQSAQAPTEFARSVRENLKTDLTEAKAQGRLTMQDLELAADVAMGIWLQVTRGTLQRRAAPDLADRALDAMLRALGVPHDSGNGRRRSRTNTR